MKNTIKHGGETIAPQEIKETVDGLTRCGIIKRLASTGDTRQASRFAYFSNCAGRLHK